MDQLADSSTTARRCPGKQDLDLRLDPGRYFANGFASRCWIVEPAKDHLARRSLQYRSYGHLNGAADHAAGMVDNHHGSVVQVADSLRGFLTLFEDHDLHLFSGQNDRLQRICKIVDIQHRNLPHMGNFVQVEIIRNNLCFHLLSDLDELEIDFANGGKVLFYDLNGQLRIGLHALQHVESAPSALATGRIGGVGHCLQLSEYELRDDQRSFKKSSLGNVGDSPVDDGACIEDLEASAGAAFPGKQAAQGGEVQQVSLAGANHKAH